MRLTATRNREFELVVACCLWPPSPARNAAVATAAAGPIDWARFVRVVRRQRVPGLVWNGLMQAGVDLPPEIAQKLKADAGQTARANLMLCAEAIQLQRKFEAAGLACAFLKGATVAVLAYGELGIRHAKDIDMLVSEADFSAACDLLVAQDYRRTKPAGPVSEQCLALWRRFSKDMEWHHDGKRINLELHWKLTTFSFLLTDPADLGRLQLVPVSAGLPLATLPQPDLFGYLCVHGANHGWSRLKWLADVNALLAGRPAAVIEEYFRFATERGIDRPVGQALLLCRLLFGLELPAGVAAKLDRSRIMVLSARAARFLMTRGGAEAEIYDLPFGTTYVYLLHFLMMKSLRDAASEAFNRSINLDDVIDMPLPGWLGFLYPLLRWPLWCVRRLSAAGASR